MTWAIHAIQGKVRSGRVVRRLGVEPLDRFGSDQGERSRKICEVDNFDGRRLMGGLTGVRVYVDREKSIASRAFSLSAPEIFEQDEDGVGVVVIESPSADQVTAARACPAAAIWLEEE